MLTTVDNTDPEHQSIKSLYRNGPSAGDASFQILNQID